MHFTLPLACTVATALCSGILFDPHHQTNTAQRHTVLSCNLFPPDTKSCRNLSYTAAFSFLSLSLSRSLSTLRGGRPSEHPALEPRAQTVFLACTQPRRSRTPPAHGRALVSVRVVRPPPLERCAGLLSNKPSLYTIILVSLSLSLTHKQENFPSFRSRGESLPDLRQTHTMGSPFRICAFREEALGSSMKVRPWRPVRQAPGLCMQ